MSAPAVNGQALPREEIVLPNPPLAAGADEVLGDGGVRVRAGLWVRAVITLKAASPEADGGPVQAIRVWWKGGVDPTPDEQAALTAFALIATGRTLLTLLSILPAKSWLRALVRDLLDAVGDGRACDEEGGE